MGPKTPIFLIAIALAITVIFLLEKFTQVIHYSVVKWTAPVNLTSKLTFRIENHKQEPPVGVEGIAKPPGSDIDVDHWLNLVRSLVCIPPDKGYGSHQVNLLAAAYVTDGPMLEMGSGNFSTPMLHNISQDRERLLYTAETNYKWIHALKHYQSQFHFFRRVRPNPIWNDWDVVGDAQRRWGLVFIDHQPVNRRSVDLHRLRSRTDLFVVHDAQFIRHRYNFTEFKYQFFEWPKGYVEATNVVSNTRGDLVNRTRELVNIARATGVL